MPFPQQADATDDRVRNMLQPWPSMATASVYPYAGDEKRFRQSRIQAHRQHSHRPTSPQEPVIQRIGELAKEQRLANFMVDDAAAKNEIASVGIT